MSLRFVTSIALTVFLTSLTSKPAIACPFCEAVGQTIRQEMAVMDAVVIATSIPTSAGFHPETGEVRMRIDLVLKGGDLVKAGQEVKVILYGDVEAGQQFMLSGVDPSDMQWSALPLTERTKAYVIKIPTLPDDDAERLKFFYDYLQDDETMLSRDAYDEFAITSYSAFKKMKKTIEHDKVLEWLAVPSTTPERKRLYLTMLGVVGDAQDLPFLEAMMRSSQKSSRSGLDALIGCYLTLAGKKGLPLINELFLRNHQASYADTYAAIMAIRFHGTEGEVIARDSLVPSLHYVLDREDLADLVIPDLARWADWSQVGKMKQLFIKAEADNNWVRVPVINYLRACPLPQAKETLKELEKIDPESFKRASTFFSIPVPAQDTSGDGASMKSPHPFSLVPPLTCKSRAALPHAREARVSGSSRSQAGARERGFFRPDGSILNSATAFPTANSWHLLYVVSLSLSSVMIGQYLILSGGAV